MKQIIYLLPAIVICLMAASCKPTPEPDPVYQGPNWQPQVMHGEPEWAVNDSSVDILSTMNIVATVRSNEIIVSDADKMAVFCHNECIAVETPIMDEILGNREYLTMYRPFWENDKLTIGYYNAQCNRTFWWKEVASFKTDLIIGSSLNPIILNINSACDYQYTMNCLLNLPQDIKDNWCSKDELAMFCGEQCRYTFKWNGKSHNERFDISSEIPVSAEHEVFNFRYFSATTNMYYQSKDYDFYLNDILEIINLEF